MLQKFDNRFANSIIWNLFLLTAGGIITTISVNCVAVPHKFLAGGIMGLSLLISDCLPVLPPLILYGLFCIPIFIAGWFFIGRKFLLYTFYGTAVIVFSGFLINFEIQITNEIYAAIAGGILYGAGSGIMLRSLGSAGGTDIIAVLLKRRWNVPIGQFNFLFNAALFLCGVFYLSLDLIIASLILCFIASQTLEYVLGMFNRRKLMLIISTQGEAINEAILATEYFGVTLLHGKGGWSGQNCDILLTVTNNVAIKRLETLVYSIDPKAMVIVENTFYVSGGQFARPQE